MIRFKSYIEILDDKLKIIDKNKEFFVNDVNFIEIIATKNQKMKIFGVMICFLIFLSFFFTSLLEKLGLNTIIIINALIITVTFYLDDKKYAVQIITCYAEREVVTVSKNELSQANKFIKSFYDYKESNPKLKLPKHL